jgi:hypothetical protein
MLSSATLRPWYPRPNRPARKFQPFLEQLEARCLLTLLPAPTTDTVGVIEDQLTLQAPSPEVTFIATHADGTQKQTANLNQLYTSINPNWYLLHYQLGTGNSAYDYIINNGWSQDYDPALPDFVDSGPTGPGGVTSHEDWFEHSDGSLDPSTTGNRLVNDAGLYLANVDSDGWRNYEATTLVQNLVAAGARGVFADSFAGPAFGYYVNQGDRRFDYGGPYPGPADPNVWPDGRTWLDRAAAYIAYIQGQLTTAGEALYGPGNGFAYVPNGGPLNTGWADIDYSASKGYFAEGLPLLGGPAITGADWNLSMNRALRFTSTSDPGNADRMFIMQPYPSAPPDSPQGLQQRSWAFGSYLLLKGDHTYINMYAAGGGTSLMWYPEYQVNLGAAQDPGGMPTDVSGYYDPGSGLYVRHFENGIVLLNNSGTSRVYNPGQVMQQVLVNGWGGSVRPGDIDPATNTYVGGWLSSQLVSTATVAPYSSVILINQGTPIDGSGGSPVPRGRGTSAVNFVVPPLALPTAAGPVWGAGVQGTVLHQAAPVTPADRAPNGVPVWESGSAPAPAAADPVHAFPDVEAPGDWAVDALFRLPVSEGP